MSSETLSLAKSLIERPSVTPEAAGCQALISERLQNIGFTTTDLPFEDVSNIWVRRGDSAPLFVFAGHTDVVPTGPENNWRFPPFTPTEADGQMYGRGSADMKSSIAAMIVACEGFIKDYPNHKGSIAFLLTSDEEGPAINGTVKVVDHLVGQDTNIDWCIVGEPSSTAHVGDVIKNGRRGSINGRLTVKGKQGHVAYPHLAENPIHHLNTALGELLAIEWDHGNDHFPATSFQISNVTGGTGADNVIPGTAEARFNLRFSTEISDSEIKQKVAEKLDSLNIDYDLNWVLSGQPFLTAEGSLVDACKESIHAVTGNTTQLSTGGGTSDGRFIAPTGAQVVELGPVNATIHQIDEHTDTQELDQLTQIYYQVLKNLLL